MDLDDLFEIEALDFQMRLRDSPSPRFREARVAFSFQRCSIASWRSIRKYIKTSQRKSRGTSEVAIRCRSIERKYKYFVPGGDMNVCVRLHVD